jgi:hypothetical protein
MSSSLPPKKHISGNDGDIVKCLYFFSGNNDDIVKCLCFFSGNDDDNT